MTNTVTATSRSEINIQDTWDLTPLCPTVDAYQKDYTIIENRLSELSEFRGTIGKDPHRLYAYLHLKDSLLMVIDRLYSYSFQLLDQDTTQTDAQALKDQSLGLYNRFFSEIAWEAPELLELTEETLETWCEELPELMDYKHYIQDTLRQKPHTLSAEMEELLSLTADMSYGPQNIFSMFNNADLQFPDIEDAQGNMVTITHGNYISFMESKNRDVRKRAFEALYHTYGTYKNTLAAIYGANAKKELFYTKARNYSSTMECHLDGNNIPTTVYTQLIDTVHEFLPVMYRYVALRKKLLNVEELHMYDVYTPIVEYQSPVYDYETAKNMILEGLKPLGEDYIALLKEGFEQRWIDVYENKGKRSGAYSTCVYGHHPYVLLNYQGTLDHVFTIAHEMGHSLHSCYTNMNQSYINSNYNIFVAEIASTCNEYLLISHLLKKSTSDSEKAYLLNHLLDQFKGTLFRQTMFAEFEMITHQMEAEGKALTCDALCTIYKELNQLYFGEDMVIDDEIALEWARIPHFYSPFYVYQYATGLSAAIAFGQRILTDDDALYDYKRFLSGGCSMDCLDLLKACGIDMTTGEPVAEALRVFEQCLTELENLF